MASEKISQFTDGNPAQAADQIPINRGGTNFRVTATSVAALAAGSSAANPGYFVGGNIAWRSVAAQINPSFQGTNKVNIFPFVLPFSITVTKVTVEVTSNAPGTFMNVGLYSASGAKVLDSGQISLAATGDITTVLGSSVALTADTTYYLAWSSDDGSNASAVAAVYSAADLNILNASQSRWTKAANLTSGGVFPATLGALSGTATIPVFVLFEA